MVPWRRSHDGGVERVDVVVPVFGRGDWAAVEDHLGLGLPADYRALVGEDGAWVFGDELVIASPFDARRHLNLVAVVADGAWGEAHLRDRHPAAGVPLVYPEPGGLLTWGNDGGGAVYHWDTASTDPDEWTVAITGRSVDGVERHPLTLTGYLDALARGDIASSSLDDWPEEDAALHRL